MVTYDPKRATSSDDIGLTKRNDLGFRVLSDGASGCNIIVFEHSGEAQPSRRARCR